jgi:outer membrane protein assembly factor BamB
MPSWSSDSGELMKLFATLPRLAVLIGLCLPASFGWTADPAASLNPTGVDLNDWPWWRGPLRNGVAPSGQTPPTEWSDEKNVVWKTSIPGRGHGSPIVVGDQVVLLAVDLERQVQLALCFNRATGQTVWERAVHTGGVEVKQNDKSTQANSTPACDGKRIYVNFLNAGAIWTSALDREGNILWQKKVSDYVLHQGFSSSPAIYGDLVIVSADNKGTGAVAALDRVTGEQRWKRSRPALPNYTSPIIFHVNGRDQLFFLGCDLVTSLDPATGETLWEMPGATTECVTSTVTDGSRIFTSGGYPKNHLAAVEVDGTAKVAWENGSRVYVPSMIHRDGYLYAMLDAGVAQCWKSETGEEQWKARVGGTFSSSLVLVGDNIFATDEAGKTTIFKASPDKFEKVAQNQLGDEVFATPAICGSRIYHRVAVKKDNQQQGFLYCLGAMD